MPVLCECAACGAYFHRVPSKVGRYCSVVCALRSRPLVPPFNRFIAKVKKTKTCWLWTGAVNSNGYGHLFLGDGLVYAHRYAYWHYLGTIPDGMNVLHRCDTPNCVNPEHLYTGNQKQNGRDAAERDRMPKGTRHHAAKLTPKAVHEIRLLAGKIPQTRIAQIFGICQQSVSDIVRGLSWHHI